MLDQLFPTDPVQVGRYRLLGRLGAGGMGVVYLAQAPDGATYALKVLSGNHRLAPELRRRLDREARSLMVLDSPHVVRMVEVDTDAEVPYLVMAYAQGEGLDQAVPAGGFPTDTVRRYGMQLADALAEVHGHGIVHRDLKPNNVILGPSGVTLVDFGIASLDDEGTTALTREGALLGSLAWLAPEVIAGGIADEHSDVFGLGLILGYLALGRHPYGVGRPEAVMYRIMHERPDLRDCEPAIAAIIDAALARDPAGRPTAPRVRELLASESTEVPVIGGRPVTHGRRTAAWILAVTGATAIGLASWFGVTGAADRSGADRTALETPADFPVTPTAAATPASDDPPAVGALSVGMTLDQAVATGQAQLEPEPYGPGSDPALAAVGDGPGICTFGSRISDFIINDPQWTTPEGIGLGSRVDQVHGAYPDAEADYAYGADETSAYYLLVSRSGWGYQFYVQDGTVQTLVFGRQSGAGTYLEC